MFKIDLNDLDIKYGPLDNQVMNVENVNAKLDEIKEAISYRYRYNGFNANLDPMIALLNIVLTDVETSDELSSVDKTSIADRIQWELDGCNTMLTRPTSVKIKDDNGVVQNYDVSFR